jgi:glycerate 2-kinase
MRSTLRTFFEQALEECSVARAFERHVSYERGVLRVCEDLYALSDYSRVFVVSIGKAAHSTVEALTSKLGRGAVQGIVVGPVPPQTIAPGMTYFAGGHPLPTAESVRAAESVLYHLERLDAGALVIFLLSGGGSALAEKPLYSEISLNDLIQTYRVLVHSGAPIAEINAIRKHLSAVKGGRMAAAAAPARQLSVLVSDVPDNALDSLASGPTMPDSTTTEDCYRLASSYGMVKQFPESVAHLFRTGALEETPKSDDPAFVQSRWWTVLSNATARNAAAEHARSQGFTVEIDNTCDDWDYAKAADYLLNRLRELKRSSVEKGVRVPDIGTPLVDVGPQGSVSPRVCLISGGEVTVCVTNPDGVGGRNQQFALYCATKISGENIAVLSAGTDGIDGNSAAAGAVVDGTTVSRAKQFGLDIDRALRQFNAFPVFESLGDAIITGPTGNNVRDLRILVSY